MSLSENDVALVQVYKESAMFKVDLLQVDS